MKEKIKENWKWIKWILIILIVYMGIYLIYPKYYFTDNIDGYIRFRCNKITGQCEKGGSLRSWMLLD